MKRYALTFLLLALAAPLGAQSRADTLHLRDAVARLAQVRDASNNSRGAKDMAARAIAAESVYFRSKAPVTPPPPPPPPTPLPTASFSRSCASVTRMCSVNAGASTGATAYAWAWGDNTTATGVTATRVYAAAGSYTIRLTVTGAGGTASTAQTVTLVAPTPPPDTVKPPPPDTVVPTPVVNKPPVARFTATPVVGRPLTIKFDARGSSDDKGITRYEWKCNMFPECTATTDTFTITYPDADAPRRPNLTVYDAEGLSDRDTVVVILTAPPPPPRDSILRPPGDTVIIVQPGTTELPRATPSANWPFPVLRTVRVAAGQNLQAALSAAQPGDDIRLAAGATFTGNFRLPVVCAAGQGVTIRSDIPDPPNGVRITPVTTTGFAKIVSPNSDWALRIDGPSCNVRLLALDISFNGGASINYGVLWLGNGGWAGNNEMQSTLAMVPQNVVVDRVYVHAAPSANTTRCVAQNAGNSSIVNSWISDCHANGDDSQAIAGWNGPGPYLIENNYLEGAGENIIFGGADPGIAGLTPSDITIRRNHFYKPLTWRSATWQVKNLFELKNAKRVLAEANVFENSWPAAQEGWAFIFASINQGGQAWGKHSTVQDVTLRWNTIDNVHHGLVIAEANDYAGVGATPAARIAATDNRWTRIESKFYLINSGFVGAVFDRNTAQGPYSTLFQIGQPNTALRFPGFSFRGNRGGPALYALNSPVGDGAAMFRTFAIPLTSFVGNCVTLGSGQSDLNSTAFPGNTFVSLFSQCPTISGVDEAELLRRVAGVVVVPPPAAGVSFAVPLPAAKPLPLPRTRADSVRLAREPKGTATLGGGRK